MKIYIYIFALVMALNSVFAFNGKWILTDFDTTHLKDWEYPPQILYKAIDCADSLNCIAVGNIGLNMPYIKMTSDGGRSWKTVLADTNSLHGGHLPPMLLDVAYPDTNLCIVACDSNAFMRSTDKGKTWSRDYVPGNYAVNQVKDFRVKMFDKNYGCLCVLSKLYLTSDGGINWNKAVIDLPDSIKPTTFYEPSLPEKDVIIALAYNKNLRLHIIKSEDWGKSWVSSDSVPNATIIINGNIYNLTSPRSLSFINRNEGWLSCVKYVSNSINRDVILHTTNASKDWEIQLDSLTKQYGLYKIYMNKDLNGFAFGPFNDLWRTTDGGKKWIIDSSFNDQNTSITDVAFFSQTNIIGVTYDQKIFKFTDEETGIPDNSSKQSVTDQSGLYPNPSLKGESVNISYQAKRSSSAIIYIYNSSGQMAEEPYNVYLNEGDNNLNYTPGSDMPAGVYFIRIISATGETAIKPWVIKN